MRPDRDPRGVSCGQKVCVDPADSKPGQAMPPDEVQHLIVGRDRQGRELAEQINRRTGLSKMPERQFADDEGMRHHGAILELANQLRDGASEMIDPG